jgi:hypothetical protein
MGWRASQKWKAGRENSWTDGYTDRYIDREIERKIDRLDRQTLDAQTNTYMHT